MTMSAKSWFDQWNSVLSCGPEHAQGLAVDVVDDGGREEEPADRPSPPASHRDGSARYRPVARSRPLGLDEGRGFGEVGLAGGAPEPPRGQGPAGRAQPKRILRRRAREPGVEEAGVEGIAGPGGVEGLDREGGGAQEQRRLRGWRRPRGPAWPRLACGRCRASRSASATSSVPVSPRSSTSFGKKTSTS